MWCCILLAAGIETTGNLIGGGMDLLLRHPDALARLVADRSLIRPALSEMLRILTPGRYIRRTATADTELGGHEICAGEAVAMNFTVANYDPEMFPEPAALRHRPQPQRGARLLVRAAPLHRDVSRADGDHHRPRGAARALPADRAARACRGPPEHGHARDRAPPRCVPTRGMTMAPPSPKRGAVRRQNRGTSAFHTKGYSSGSAQGRGHQDVPQVVLIDAWRKEE